MQNIFQRDQPATVVAPRAEKNPGACRNIIHQINLDDSEEHSDQVSRSMQWNHGGIWRKMQRTFVANKANDYKHHSSERQYH